MCGRYALVDNPVNHQERTDLSLFGELELADLLPRYNVAPTSRMPVVVESEVGRGFEVMRWGLIPGWAKDASGAARMINARAETAAEKPAFRSAFQRRRCLVPASGYYEWMTTQDGKQPQWIHPRDGGLLWFAGLWEQWHSPDGPLRTYAILTKTAEGIAAEIHHRMPALLQGEELLQWLDPGTAPLHLHALLQPRPHPELAAYPVTRAVNRVGYEDPEALLPVERTVQATLDFE